MPGSHYFAILWNETHRRMLFREAPSTVACVNETLEYQLDIHRLKFFSSYKKARELAFSQEVFNGTLHIALKTGLFRGVFCKSCACMKDRILGPPAREKESVARAGHHDKNWVRFSLC